MDQCSRPLKLPKEFMDYAEKNKLFDFFGNLMKSLIVNKPTSPIDFLINELDQLQNDMPRIILYGPPASGKSSLAQKLNEEFKVKIITINSLFEDANYETREKISDLINSDAPVPLELIAKMISDRTNQFDCRMYGWVIDGIIDSKELFQNIQSLGVFPTHVVHLTTQDDGSLITRAENARIDVKTGKIYNLLYNPPPEEIELEWSERYSNQQMLESLVKYHREKTRFEEAYNNVKKINSNRPFKDVVKEVFFYVSWEKASCSPRVPKIIIIGPPCSGKSKIADLLSKRYEFGQISVKHLIKQEIERKTTLGDLILEYNETQSPIPPSIKIKCLNERLKQKDCLVKGWIMYNFPETLNEALLLGDSNINPDKVFFIEMNDETVVERKTLKRTDPITGKSYNLRSNPPESGYIARRLVQNPKNFEYPLNKQLAEFNENEKDLRKYFMDKKIGVVINGEQDILTIFETIDAHLHYLQR